MEWTVSTPPLSVRQQHQGPVDHLPGRFHVNQAVPDYQEAPGRDPVGAQWIIDTHGADKGLVLYIVTDTETEIAYTLRGGGSQGSVSSNPTPPAALRAGLAVADLRKGPR